MTDSVYIGVDVGGTSLRAARFIGQSSTPDAQHKIPTQVGGDAEGGLDRLKQAIREVAPDLANVAALGLGLPGPVVPAALGDDAGLVEAGALAMEESRTLVVPDR